MVGNMKKIFIYLLIFAMCNLLFFGAVAFVAWDNPFEYFATLGVHHRMLVLVFYSFIHVLVKEIVYIYHR